MKKLFTVLLALLMVLVISTAAFADFGDYAGDSDWGSDWDSGWDYDSGSDWDSGWDDWNDDDWGSGSSSSGSSGGFSALEFVVAAIIVAIVIGSSAIKPKRRKGNNAPAPRVAPLVNDLSGLKERDPAFNESKFLADSANLYIRLQEAWSKKNLTPVRTRLAEELYARSERQINAYIANNQTNRIEKISVLNASIVGCTKDSKNDIITVELRTRIIDYVTDDRTGNVVRGNPKKELFMIYRWTFIRTLGKLTGEDGTINTKQCPNCGAPVNLNQSAICSYCGSVCTSGDYDWILSDIKGISQRTS